jgi:ferredoxin
MAGMRHTGQQPATATSEGPVMADKARLRVHVNPDKCQGHNRCKAIAPELFELDGYGNAREIGDGAIPPELEEKAYLAKSNCPEFAVEIIESETCK